MAASFSIQSSANFEDSEKITISATNARSHNLHIRIGNAVIKSIIGIKSGDTVSLTQSELNTVYGILTSTMSTTVRYQLVTYYYNSASAETTNKDVTRKIANYTPTWTADRIIYTDYNTATSNITGDNQRIVQNKSTLRVSFNGATAVKGSSISSYVIKVGNLYTETRQSAGTIDFGIVNSAQNVDIEATATDARGQSVTVKKTVTIVEYSAPTVSVQAARVNNYESTIKLTGKSSYVSVGSNAVTLTYQYKRADDDNYYTAVALEDNHETTINLNNAFDYDIKVNIIDSFGENGSTTVRIPKGKFVFFIDTENSSIGVNEFPDIGEAARIKGGTTHVDSLTVNNNLVVDHIIEDTIDTSNKYHLRKWASGYCELTMWKDFNVSAYTAWGGINYKSLGSWTYPDGLQFSTVISAFASANSTQSDCFAWLKGAGATGVADSFIGKGSTTASIGTFIIKICGIIATNNS